MIETLIVESEYVQTLLGAYINFSTDQWNLAVSVRNNDNEAISDEIIILCIICPIYIHPVML